MSAVRCASNWGPARQTVNELVIQLLQHYGISYPELNTPEKCRKIVQDAGSDRVTVQVAQEQHFTPDPEASFNQAWARSSRFGIQIAPEALADIKAQYIRQFTQLVKVRTSGITTMSSM
jgi:hypothetical protein